MNITNKINPNIWIETVILEFTKSSDPNVAISMAKYMKNHFPFLGLTSPKRAAILSPLLSNIQRPSKSNLFTLTAHLWNLPEREYQYVAIALLEKFEKQLTPEDIPQILALIPEKSWWDTVDALAGSVLSKIVKKHPNCLYPCFQSLIASHNFWENRTAIIVQLKCGSATNTEFLTQAILPHLPSKEFFLRKAIGWALRQFARTNPSWVIDFVNRYEPQLSGLSKREALKHLTTF